MTKFDTSNATKLHRVRERGRLFAEQHVHELAMEILEWQNTAVLRDGKLRELAHILEALDASHALKIAENFAIRASLELAAQQDPSKLASS
jgi:hypothetical protein